MDVHPAIGAAEDPALKPLDRGNGQATASPINGAGMFACIGQQLLDDADIGGAIMAAQSYGRLNLAHGGIDSRSCDGLGLRLVSLRFDLEYKGNSSRHHAPVAAE